MAFFYKDTNVYSKLKNPEKYIGKTKQIITRSRWEKVFINRFLDCNDDIIYWSSEDFCIPYLYEVDKRQHRYFPDFYFKSQDGKEFIVEIKPYEQCFPPKKQKRHTKAYKKRIDDYIKNQNKWNATKNLVENLRKKGRDIEFKIITEKELFGKIK